jgi:heptosyltransferase II
MKINIIKSIDKYFGSLIVVFLSFFHKDESRKIAVIQLFGVGETVLTLPAIKDIKAKYPDKELFVFCTRRNYAVYENQPFIDAIVMTPLNALHLPYIFIRWFRSFHKVYDFEEYLNISALLSFFIGRERYGFSHGYRSLLYHHCVNYVDNRYVVEEFNSLAGKGMADVSLLPLRYSAESGAKTDEWFSNNNLDNKLVVGLCDEVAESARQRLWSPERWLKLYDQLESQGHHPVFILGPTRSWPNKLKQYRIFQMNLFCLYRFLERCEVVISLDTGVMHMAAAMGSKTVSLFGPNLPERWAPRHNGRYIFHEEDCCPCIDTKTGKMNKCKKVQKNGISKCMDLISVADVLKAAGDVK